MEDTGVMFYNLGMHMASYIWHRTHKINKTITIKLCSINIFKCLLKHNQERKNKQRTEHKEVFANHLHDEGLRSGLDKELPTLNSKSLKIYFKLKVQCKWFINSEGKSMLVKSLIEVRGCLTGTVTSFFQGQLK